MVVATAGALQARTRKGDKLAAQGKQAELRQDWEKALEFYEQALAQDPSDAMYLLNARRARFAAAQARIDGGQKLRREGKLEEALEEFKKAYLIDPSSPIAEQELGITLDMMERDRKAREKGEPLKPEERSRTPGEAARHDAEERLASVRSVAVLKPLSPAPITLKMNNQPPKVLFETVGKLAGINVLFDPEYQSQAQARNVNVELANATLEEALDYLAVLTKSFWKPLSANAVFVTVDNQNKRQEYEEHVTRIFYLTNVTAQQEVQEIMSVIRAVGNVQRVFAFNAQNAIIVRGTADTVELAEMIIHNLDRPRSEVVVDVIVMEANRSRTRDLTLSPTSGANAGINIPLVFTPGGPKTTGGDGDGKTGSGATALSLARLGKLSSNDYSLTLPGAMLEALMSDRGTRVLQSPQVRTVDGQKASLKIGDRVPYSTGGFQPAFGQVGTGFNSLYSSFQFLDVGVNVDITPKVHSGEEVSLHIELDISNVRDRIDIGGISQPVVGQRKVVHDIRLREGEVSLLGGLIQQQETKAISGVPGLASIPLLRRLFTSESIEKNESEMLIAIVPHVVRTPDFDESSYKGIASGSERVIRLNYAPRRAEEPAAPKPPAPAPAAIVPGAPVVAEPAPAKPEPAPPAAKPEPEQPPAPALAAAKPEAPAPAPPPGVPAVPMIVPAAKPSVAFAPATVEAQPGATVTLELQVLNVADLFDAPLRFKFDPHVLRLNEITRGGLFRGDFREVIFTRNILNDTGDATVNLGRMEGMGGVSGSGTLVTLTFQVVGKGSTTVTAPQVSLRDSRGQTILSASPQVTVQVK